MQKVKILFNIAVVIMLNETILKRSKNVLQLNTLCKQTIDMIYKQIIVQTTLGFGSPYFLTVGLAKQEISST